MTEQRFDLSDGGMVLVVLGRGYECPAEYRYHPRVQVVDACAVKPSEAVSMVPSNAKVAVITSLIPPPVFTAFKQVFSRRRLTYLPRSTPAALATQLKEILSTTTERVVDVEPERGRANGVAATLGEVARVTEAKVQQVKGSLTEFVKAEADLKRGTAEEARRLFDLARKRGLTTTLASLQQTIRTHKRKGGLSDRPLSATPGNERLEAMALLDNAIDGLQKLRAFVERVDAENDQKERLIAKLRARMDLLNEAFKNTEE